jgi:hypothetical protein
VYSVCRFYKNSFTIRTKTTSPNLQDNAPPREGELVGAKETRMGDYILARVIQYLPTKQVDRSSIGSLFVCVCVCVCVCVNSCMTCLSNGGAQRYLVQDADPTLGPGQKPRQDDSDSFVKVFLSFHFAQTISVFNDRSDSNAVYLRFHSVESLRIVFSSHICVYNAAAFRTIPNTLLALASTQCFLKRRHCIRYASICSHFLRFCTSYPSVCLCCNF